MNRPNNKAGSAKGIGRIGALAVALGVGAALIGAPAVASADTAKPDRSSSSSSSASSRSGSSTSAASSAKRPSSQSSAASEAARKRAETRKLIVSKPGSWVNTDADNEFSRKRSSSNSSGNGFYDDSKFWDNADDEDIVLKLKKGR